MDRTQLIRMALALVELSRAGVEAQIAMRRMGRAMRHARPPRGPSTPRVVLPHAPVRTPYG